MKYRIVGKTVEAFHNGKWIVAYYCTSKERAAACLIECEQEALKWSKLSEEERISKILRESEAADERK